jgi:hypothetical protein
MQVPSVLSRLGRFAGAFKPWVRVIGLAYTGLGGMLALVLVISVALVPVGPALQQVAEPARQVIGNVVQPTSDVVTTFLGGGPAARIDPVASVVWPSGASLFADSDGPQAEIAEAPFEEPPPVVAASARRTTVVVAQSPAPEAVDEIVGLEPIEISAPHAVVPVVVVVVPAPTAGLQIASYEAPRALPTLPTPTETARQIKTRLDVANQAAIDAAKVAQARAKAESDAANNAAIAARKAAATAATPTSAPTQSTTTITAAKPSAGATPAPPIAHSKAAAAAANQAAIDAAKLAQGRARAEANAANQAAQSAKLAAKTTPVPTAQPTPAPARPTALATPTRAAVESPPAPVSVDVVDQLIDEASLENAPFDQAATLSDGTPD